MKHELASSTALSNQRMLVEYLKPDAIRCNPKNPRRHGKKDVRDLAASVRALGANIPIGVDASGVIVSGELWYHAYLELQLPLIPVIRLHHLSQAEADLFTIAVNKFTDRTKFDNRALGKLFKELSALNLDIGLEVSGFETAEIDRMGCMRDTVVRGPVPRSPPDILGTHAHTSPAYDTPCQQLAHRLT